MDLWTMLGVAWFGAVAARGAWEVWPYLSTTAEERRNEKTREAAWSRIEEASKRHGQAIMVSNRDAGFIPFMSSRSVIDKAREQRIMNEPQMQRVERFANRLYDRVDSLDALTVDERERYNRVVSAAYERVAELMNQRVDLAHVAAVSRNDLETVWRLEPSPQKKQEISEWRESVEAAVRELRDIDNDIDVIARDLDNMRQLLERDSPTVIDDVSVSLSKFEALLHGQVDT